jgi:hypothetical protein
MYRHVFLANVFSLSTFRRSSLRILSFCGSIYVLLYLTKVTYKKTRRMALAIKIGLFNADCEILKFGLAGHISSTKPSSALVRGIFFEDEICSYQSPEDRYASQFLAC